MRTPSLPQQAAPAVIVQRSSLAVAVALGLVVAGIVVSVTGAVLMFGAVALVAAGPVLVAAGLLIDWERLTDAELADASAEPESSGGND